jgi:hypothetical protein
MHFGILQPRVVLDLLDVCALSFFIVEQAAQKVYTIFGQLTTLGQVLVQIPFFD